MNVLGLGAGMHDMSQLWMRMPALLAPVHAVATRHSGFYTPARIPWIPCALHFVSSCPVNGVQSVQQLALPSMLVCLNVFLV